MLLVISVIVFLIYQLLKWSESMADISVVHQENYPDAKAGEVYHKSGFTLSYVEAVELAEWVSYSLNVDMLNAPKHERTQDFNPDPDIKSGSAHYHDYKGSGYRRGHLVPSADMASNKASMDATFLMSNVAPMKENFNDGIWLELEQNVRDWARLNGAIQVVTGPVLQDVDESIGQNEVGVPAYFFKAIFTLQHQHPQVIGFLFNQFDEDFTILSDYMVSIDSIEKVTGLDLFANQYGSWEKEIALEKEVGDEQSVWPFNDRWYRERLKILERNTGD